jgi:hypothetical protein
MLSKMSASESGHRQTDGYAGPNNNLRPLVGIQEIDSSIDVFVEVSVQRNGVTYRA